MIENLNLTTVGNNNKDNVGSLLVKSTLTAEGRSNFLRYINSTDKSANNIVKDIKTSQEQAEKVSMEIARLFPQILLNVMFNAIDEETEDGGFNQGMFRYIMIEKLSEEWVKAGQVDDIKNSVYKQLSPNNKKPDSINNIPETCGRKISHEV